MWRVGPTWGRIGWKLDVDWWAAVKFSGQIDVDLIINSNSLFKFKFSKRKSFSQEICFRHFWISKSWELWVLHRFGWIVHEFPMDSCQFIKTVLIWAKWPGERRRRGADKRGDYGIFRRWAVIFFDITMAFNLTEMSSYLTGWSPVV